MSNERKKMHERIDKREKFLLGVFATVREDIEAGRYDDTEPARQWMEQFCEGVGIQLCAGEFQLADSLGVNTDPKAVATDHWAFADRFAADLPKLDYLVTNYLECFPDPLRVLQDWRPRMKEGAVLAVVARDADQYQKQPGEEGAMGPLVNRRRVSCFTLPTLRFYVERAGYTVFRAEREGKEIRIAARRR